MNNHRSAEAVQARTRTEGEPASEVVRVRTGDRAAAPKGEAPEFEDDLYDNVACTD